MQTVTIALAPSVALTTETSLKIMVTIEGNGAVAWERLFLEALKAAEKALKAHGRRLAKMADVAEVLKKGRDSEWNQRLVNLGVDYRAANTVLAAAETATNARRDAIPGERAAARKAASEVARAEERAAWDAKWGALDAATAGYYREMGWMPARP